LGEKIAIIEFLVQAQLFILLANDFSQKWHSTIEKAAVIDQTIVNYLPAIHSYPKTADEAIEIHHPPCR
jgi:hypothetical protein